MSWIEHKIGIFKHGMHFSHKLFIKYVFENGSYDAIHTLISQTITAKYGDIFKMPITVGMKLFQREVYELLKLMKSRHAFKFANSVLDT